MNSFIKDIEKKYGKHVLFNPEDQAPLDVITTGSLSLDVSTGIGGIPKRKFTQIFGPEGTGKTTIGLELASQVLKFGGKALFIDVENMLDFDYAFNVIGENRDDERFLVVQPLSGEDSMLIAEDAIRSEEFDLVVIDSIAALAPKREQAKDLDDSTVGEVARLMSKFQRRNAYYVRSGDVAVLYLNQVRAKVGSFMGGYTFPGGHAIGHYCSIIIQLYKGVKIQKDSEVIGIQSKFTTVKNKLAPPYRSHTVPIIFGKGIDTLWDSIEFAKKLGVIKLRGPYYYFGDDKLGQGLANTKEYLGENSEVLDKITEMCYNVGVSDKVKEEVVNGKEH